MAEILKLPGAWLCFVPPVREEIALTPNEALLLDGIRAAARRRDWLAGRWAAKELVKSYSWESHGVDLSFSQIEIIHDEAGAPVLQSPALPFSLTSERKGGRGVRVSLSIAHSAGHALAGLCERDSLGVDLQKIRSVSPRLFRRALLPHERAQCPDERTLILFWALKEAALKAHRVRPAPSLQEIAVTLTESNRAVICVRDQKILAHWGQRREFIWACAVL